MTGLGLVSVIAGGLVIIARAPLIFRPEQTRDFYLKALATHSRIRLLGVGVVSLGAALILTGRGHQETAAVFMMAVGCVLAYVAGFVMLVMPALVKLIGESLWKGMDKLMLRGAGILSALVGAFFIGIGVHFLRL